MHSLTQSQNEFSESTLELDWEALTHNILYFKNLLRVGTKVMLMVKAAAYGHCATVFAKKIQENKFADYLGVTTIDEGIQLRAAGVSLPIMIQNPNPIHWNKLIEHCLEPVIFNFEKLNSFQHYLKKHISSKENSYPIHIKLNTGMNRLGFNKNELNNLISYLLAERKWNVKSVLAHLSSANDSAADVFTQEQLSSFKACKKLLKPYLRHDTLFHSLNTDGINRFTNSQDDMVRLGIGLYGASENDYLKEKLKPVATFKTKITAVRKVTKNDFISYNRNGRVNKSSNIAIISLGYADGLPRKFGNGNWEVEINEKLYPIIGNVCMDLTMVNLGDDIFDLGESVVIFGGIKTVFEFAANQDTITYEALTSIGNRVKRVLV